MLTENTHTGGPSPRGESKQRSIRVPAAPFFLTFAIALVSSSGCSRQGDEYDRVVLSGAVSYRGEPVAEGLIRFEPTAGTMAPTTVAKIKEGRYICDNKGGVPMGSHRVQIMAYRADSDPSETDLGGAMPEQYLPVKYNRKSELSITVDAGGGPVSHDWDLSE